ncbi:zeta toxin family protein [Acaryochloris marina NIES-2412]|uniref:zeta toxin family protein n=1 Tax=Acaryochloris marina TaxID=155978 RepID=UPI0040587A38
MSNLYLIGGANGSGKTTVSLSLLPTLLGVFEYVNADAIAAGLSPLNSEAMAMQAGRLMLKRIQKLADAKANFAFESTLSARSFVPFLRECRTKGYTINLMFFWLRSPELAVERVAKRVATGGHSIPETDIRRRYQRGLRNLKQLYLPICDSWIIYDNSETTLRLIAESGVDSSPIIYESETWYQILSP